MKEALRIIGICFITILMEIYATELEKTSERASGAKNDLSTQIEQASQAVQEADRRVREVMREVEYTDPECSKIKNELVALEKRVLELRQQLYAAIRASSPVRQAEAERRAAVQRLQDLRRQEKRSADEDHAGASP